MPENYIFENGYIWAVDSTGNKIQTTLRPLDADTVIMNITQRETGDSIPDPNSKYTYYTVKGYGNKDIRGYRLDRSSKDNAEFGKDYILAHPEVFGQLSEKDLKNRSIIAELLTKQYANEKDASRLKAFAFPLLYKMISPGHVSIQEGGYCYSCGKKEKYLDWTEAQYDYARGSVDKHEGYSGKLPVTVADTTYISGYAPSERIETKTVTAKTPGNQTDIKRPRPSSKPAVKKPTTYQAPVNTISKPKQESMTTKWKIVYNPFTGEEIGREEIKKQGGRMNYFSYFN